MHELVAAFRRRGWRLQGPEHRDGEGERHDYGEWDVKVLAHANRLTAQVAEHKEKLRFEKFAAKWKEAHNQRLGCFDMSMFWARGCSLEILQSHYSEVTVSEIYVRVPRLHQYRHPTAINTIYGMLSS